MTQTPAGWYPAMDSPGHLRYWDGTTWTDQYHHEEQATSAPAVAAGWYPHPTMADTQRYWDGHRWTDHIAPGLPSADAASAAAQAENQRTSSLESVGVLMMFIFPLGGFIVGCMLLGRWPGAGVVLMIGSVISAAVWYAILVDLSGPSDDRYSFGLSLLWRV